MREAIVLVPVVGGAFAILVLCISLAIKYSPPPAPGSYESRNSLARQKLEYESLQRIVDELQAIRQLLERK